MLLDSRWVVLEGLAGSEELDRRRTEVGPVEGEEELFRIIAPSLHTLTINANSGDPVEELLPLLSRLSRLSIKDHSSRSAPLLLSLPPSLSFLRIPSDGLLQSTLALWTANPSLAPAGLKHVHIDNIRDSTTFEQLPRIDTLTTTCHRVTISFLGRLAPGTFLSKTLEMRFYKEELVSVGLVQAECMRLGVILRRRMEPWDV